MLLQRRLGGCLLALLLSLVAVHPGLVAASECDAVSTAPEGMSPCAYVQTHCADTAVGIVHYLDVYYCQLAGSGLARFLYVIALVFMLAFLFLFIGTAAGDFFCPNLNTMATLLGLSENMTGVTFLALGNGAPDMFSTFNAMQQHYFGLAVGELLGAASFISTVVVGLVAIVAGFKVAPIPFTRDVCFFLVAIMFLIFVLWDGLITLTESLLLMTYYGLYVFSVGFGRYMFKRSRQRNLEKSRREREQWLQLDAESNENALIEGAEHTVYEHDSHDDSTPLVSPEQRTDGADMGRRGSAVSKTGKRIPHGLFLGDTATNDYDPWFNKHKTMSTAFVPTVDKSPASANLSSPAVLTSTQRSTAAPSSTRSPNFASKPVPISPTRSIFAITTDDFPPPPEVEHLDDAIPQNYLASSLSSSPIFSNNVALTSFPSLGWNRDAVGYTKVLSPVPADKPGMDGDGAYPATSTATVAQRRTAPQIVTPFHTHLLSHLLPIAGDFWDLTAMQKVVGILSIVPVLLLTLTVPAVDVEKEDEMDRIRQIEKEIFLVRWSTAAAASDGHENSVDSVRDAAVNRYLNSKLPPWQRWLFLCHCLTSLSFVLVGVDFWMEPMADGGSFTWGMFSLIVGALLWLSVYFFTDAYKRPKWFTLICFAGFLTAVIWIYLIANEVVSILQALGLIMNISDAILGLTIFAIGNSVSDMVADISVARMGFPNMAVAACFGGPMLNILLGIGFSSTYYNIRHGEPYPMKFTPVLMSSAVGVLVALCCSIVVIPLNGWRGTSQYGAFLICLYCVIMVCNVTVELTADGSD